MCSFYVWKTYNKFSLKAFAFVIWKNITFISVYSMVFTMFITAWSFVWLIISCHLTMKNHKYRMFFLKRKLEFFPLFMLITKFLKKADIKWSTKQKLARTVEYPKNPFYFPSQKSIWQLMIQNSGNFDYNIF